MLNSLSELFGKKKKASGLEQENKTISDVPPYPSSMMHPDQPEDAVFQEKIFDYYEKYKNSTNFDAESDAEMKSFYQEKVTKSGLVMTRVNYKNYSSMAQFLTALSDKFPLSPGSRMDHLYELDMFYISVFSRALMMDPIQIKETMIHRYSELPKDLVIDCTAESLAFACAANDKIAAQILGRLELKDMTKENAVKNTDIETKYLDDPQYGLVPEKPVFINGFGPHHIYLDALCTPDGKELTNVRRGSMLAKGINGPVDVYDLFLPNKKKYMTIYLCLYGQHNSMTAPRGLCFKA